MVAPWRRSSGKRLRPLAPRKYYNGFIYAITYERQGGRSNIFTSDGYVMPPTFEKGPSPPDPGEREVTSVRFQLRIQFLKPSTRGLFEDLSIVFFSFLHRAPFDGEKFEFPFTEPVRLPKGLRSTSMFTTAVYDRLFLCTRRAGSV